MLPLEIFCKACHEFSFQTSKVKTSTHESSKGAKNFVLYRIRQDFVSKNTSLLLQFLIIRMRKNVLMQYQCMHIFFDPL